MVWPNLVLVLAKLGLAKLGHSLAEQEWMNDYCPFTQKS